MTDEESAESTETPDGVARQVADGVYAYVQPDGSWWINNTAFVVGEQGVLAVDSCSTERRTRHLLDAIRSVTPAPVRTVVNTHHHGDHTFGNGYFTGATIMAHAEARRLSLGQQPPPNGIAWDPVEWGHLPPAPAFVTYTDGVDIWVDERRVEIRYIGTPAHTTGDSIAWIPDERVLITGDLVFNGGTPFLLMGSIPGMLRALDTLRNLEPRVVVPGHGPVCGPEVFDRVEAYVRFVWDAAQRSRAAGLSPLEAARQLDLGEFAGLLDSERIVGNLHRAYLELDGGEPGAKLDEIAGLRDMVIFNGGPLRCHA